MIIYFTGTKNSEFVATQLAALLNDELICANEYIKSEKNGDFQSEKPWIFVFPIYVSNIVITFAQFLKKSNFKGNKKAYFVATCVSAIGSAPNESKAICDLNNLEYMGIHRILMPQSYIALFKSTEPEECQKRYKQALTEIDFIAETVKNDQKLDLKLVSNREYKMTRWVEKLYYKHFTTTKKFFATDDCISCKLCEKNCPLNNIKMIENKPEWKGNCIHCMACINQCPKQAIEYGKKTLGKERYVCRAKR